METGVWISPDERRERLLKKKKKRFSGHPFCNWLGVMCRNATSGFLVGWGVCA